MTTETFRDGTRRIEFSDLTIVVKTNGIVEWSDNWERVIELAHKRIKGFCLAHSQPFNHTDVLFVE